MKQFEIIRSVEWNEAVAEYAKDSKWKDVLSSVPPMARLRLEMNLYFSKFHERKDFDRRAYLKARRYVELALDARDLECLVKNSANEDAAKHYQGLLSGNPIRIGYDDELFHEMMSHDRWGEFWVDPYDEGRLEDGTPLIFLSRIMELDASARDAKRKNKDTSCYDRRRLELLAGLSREAVCYLCAAYETTEDETPLDEREIYCRQLEVLDGRRVSGVRVTFAPGRPREEFSVDFSITSDHITCIAARYTLDGLEKKENLKLDFEDLREVEDLLYQCAFLEWRETYGNAYEANEGERWVVRVRSDVGIDPGDGHAITRLHWSCGYGEARPRQWVLLVMLIRRLRRAKGGLGRMPDFYFAQYEDKDPVDFKAAERLAFHTAFECGLCKDSAIRTEGDYTVVALSAKDAAELSHPELSFARHFAENRAAYGQSKYGFGMDLPEDATGFAIMKGRTLAFVYLGGSHADAVRLLHEMPDLKLRFSKGVPTAEEAMRKIATLFSGLALFNLADKSVPYAYTGHQAGVIPCGEAYLTSDRRLDYVYVGCNGDEFLPRFSQIGN